MERGDWCLDNYILHHQKDTSSPRWYRVPCDQKVALSPMHLHSSGWWPISFWWCGSTIKYAWRDLRVWLCLLLLDSIGSWVIVNSACWLLLLQIKIVTAIIHHTRWWCQIRSHVTWSRFDSIIARRGRRWCLILPSLVACFFVIPFTLFVTYRWLRFHCWLLCVCGPWRTIIPLWLLRRNNVIHHGGIHHHYYLQDLEHSNMIVSRSSLQVWSPSAATLALWMYTPSRSLTQSKATLECLSKSKVHRPEERVRNYKRPKPTQKYLFHDTGFTLGEGDMSTVLILYVLDLDSLSTSTFGRQWIGRR